jgi:hypothetical protein
MHTRENEGSPKEDSLITVCNYTPLMHSSVPLLAKHKLQYVHTVARQGFERAIITVMHRVAIWKRDWLASSYPDSRSCIVQVSCLQTSLYRKRPKYF